MTTKTWVFRIDGDPKGQPRIKATWRGAKIVTYTPGSADAWKNAMADVFRERLPPEPLDCPVRVDCRFYFRRPQRLLRKRDPEWAIPHTAKPDRDNLDKAVLDVLTAVGFIRDDALVYGGDILKFYVEKGAEPHALVIVSVDCE